MSNRDLGIASVAVVLLLGILMAGGWYYRDQPLQPLERLDTTRMTAAALRRGSGPMRLSVPQPWTSEDSEGAAVLRRFDGMLRRAELTVIGPREGPLFFQPDVLEIWLEDGSRITVGPALECTYTLGSETCAWDRDEIRVSLPDSPVPMTMKSREMQAWLL